ncbi:MAG: class I SAM-dependent methyltransferase, partial [Actinomycetota bacterium]|nr:class I SAM-dependent methyltransferase [Actinomycetota bacterium]
MALPDAMFDVAVCAQTLEDIHDPVWVCSELARVAHAGYVEVPARQEELTWGAEGPWVGRHHHRWLVDVVDGGLEFVLKPHDLHARPE